MSFLLRRSISSIRALAHQRNRFEALAPAGASVVSRAGHILAAFVLAGTFALSAPAAAFAEVLESDEIGNKTVAARGLSADACPDIEATHAMLVGSDGTVYFSRDVNAEVKIASLTKIMTADWLRERTFSRPVTVNEAATVGESSAGLLEGDTMSLETALYALMVPSGNDAGIAIAKSVGAHMSGDAATGYDTFIAAMNAKAADLGMSHSVYTNPHGLDFDAFGDEDLHSSARDVATLVSYAMQNDTFRGIVDAGSTTITVTSADGMARNVALQTTDELMGITTPIVLCKPERPTMQATASRAPFRAMRASSTAWCSIRRRATSASAIPWRLWIKYQYRTAFRWLC